MAVRPSEARRGCTHTSLLVRAPCPPSPSPSLPARGEVPHRVRGASSQTCLPIAVTLGSSPRVTVGKQNTSPRTDFPYRSQNAHSYTPVRTCAKDRPSLNSASQVRLHCSQGGVKFPTGGKAAMPSPRALPVREVSRSGVIPEPTVIVRMKENGIKRLAGRAWAIAPAPIRHVVSRNPEGTGYGKDDE